MLCSQYTRNIKYTYTNTCLGARELSSNVLETNIKGAEIDFSPIKGSREFYVGLVLQTKTH